jgi:uncharacterized protein
MITDTSMAHEKDFLEAVKCGDTQAVGDLLRSRPELIRAADEYDKTGLHLAAETDQVEIAQLLIDAGADIEALTSWGATPLDWAAAMGSTRVGDLLLERGANGLSLIVAAGLGKLDTVKSMIASGVDVSAHRRRGAPQAPDDHWPADSAHIRGDVLSDAVFAAARNGHTDLVEYLLDHGAHVDAKGVFGGTGLHWAAINGHRKTVELLIARGASLMIRDERFDGTPEGWANEGGHSDLADLLRVS